MMEVLRSWYRRHFSDPEAVILALLLIVGFAIVIYMGSMLAPLLAGIVIAYLLEAVVAVLQRRGTPRVLAVMLVFFGFLVSLVVFVIWLLPVLSRQISQLVRELPGYIEQGQQYLLRLPEHYPKFVSERQINQIIDLISSELTEFGQSMLSVSVASIPSLIALAVYLILVPLLVFFFLKDKDVILTWFKRYLPDRRGLANKVWVEMDLQIGNYVRGKFVEVVIVGAVTYVVFTFMGLNYAILLGVLVGLSVIVPYIGAVVVTIPVMFIALFQWGLGADFMYLMIAYLVIQGLDGNVLVPLLFSEAVNLHPVAIIVAVLFFGGLWGFWGVFFAIPLATLVRAVLSAWPTNSAISPASV